MLSPRALLGLPAAEEFAPEKAPGYYPPALTGLRGSHKGSYEAAHDLKDGFFERTPPLDTGESYDLVVVGAGISGLSAAHFFRKTAGAGAKVLILDNHDDFGGHARRNEFNEGGRLLVSYGGTLAIDSPAPYSAVAKGLISELGIDVGRWAKVLERDALRRPGPGHVLRQGDLRPGQARKGLGRNFWAPEAARAPTPRPWPRRRSARPRSATSSASRRRPSTPWPGVASSEKKAASCA